MDTIKHFENFRKFCKNVNLKLFSLYLGLSLIVPVITILVEYLVSRDPAFRTNLQLDLQNFHLYQLFTTSFVHLNFDHFLGNVTAYLLIIIYGLVLATILNKKRLYLVLTKVIVVIFLVFGALFALFNTTTTLYAGLSGIDAALTGILLLFWIMYLEQKSKETMKDIYGIVPVVLLAISAVIIVRYITLYQSIRTPLFISVLILVVMALAGVTFVYREHLARCYTAIKELDGKSRILMLTIVLVLLYFIWNLFPERLANSTRSVSITLHIGCLVVGILAGWFLIMYFGTAAYFNWEKEIYSP